MSVLAFAATALAAEQTATHPDFSGLWRPTVAEGSNGRAFAFLIDHSGENTQQTVRDGNMNYVEIDAEFFVKSAQDMPEYRPEFWDQVRTNEEFGYRRPADPGYGCKSPGIVRLGPPTEIFVLPNKVTLFYSRGGTNIWVREIPMDGRSLPKPDDYEGLRPTGSSVGHWDGDTLVIETVDFPGGGGVWYNDRGWVGSDLAKITERFRRDGATIKYDETVDDPMFVKPWARPTVTLASEKDPKALLPQPLVCNEHDAAYLPGSSN